MRNPFKSNRYRAEGVWIYGTEGGEPDFYAVWDTKERQYVGELGYKTEEAAKTAAKILEDGE